MSETDTATQGGGEPPEPAATIEDPNAPGTEEGATETTEQEPDEEAVEKARRDKLDKSFARLSAQITSARQETARLVAENEALRLRSGAAQPEPQAIPQTAEELERVREAAREEGRATAAVQLRIDAFHDAARAACDDWDIRRAELIEMGVDPEFSHLLVEMPDGARLAVALHDDPATLQRIAALKTATGRAIALGKFAASLEDGPAAVVRRPTPLPVPITPIGGRTRTAFNEYTATNADDLADRYMRQNQEKRRRGY